MSGRITVNGDQMNNAASHYLSTAEKLVTFSNEVKNTAANLQIQHSDSLSSFQSSLKQAASEIKGLSESYAKCYSCVSVIGQTYQNAESKIYTQITGRIADEDDIWGIPDFDYSNVSGMEGSASEFSSIIKAGCSLFHKSFQSIEDMNPELGHLMTALDVSDAIIQACLGHTKDAKDDIMSALKDVTKDMITSSAKYTLLTTGMNVASKIGAGLAVSLAVDLVFKSTENIITDVSNGEDAKHVAFDATVGAAVGVADDLVGKSVKFFFPNVYNKMKEGYTQFRANTLGDSVKAEQNKPAVHATSAIYGAA